jgi:hypothetical protein
MRKIFGYCIYQLHQHLQMPPVLFTILAPQKSEIPPTTNRTLRKGAGTANGTMTYDSAHTVDPTVPSAPPNTPTSIVIHPAIAASVNTQSQCPIFTLSRELRDMIYTYVFTPNFKAPVSDSPPIVHLGDLAATLPSSAFLFTCRKAAQEATADYLSAIFSFWQNDTVFSLDLSDDWEDERQRRGRHFEVLDQLDEAFLLPDLSDEQVNAMKTIVMNVKSDIGNCKLHIKSRTSRTGCRS